MGWSPFSPKGSQSTHGSSTHGSSVGMDSPYPLPGEALSQHRLGRGATQQGSPSPALASIRAAAQATKLFIKARVAAAMAPGSPPGCLEQPEGEPSSTVDSLYLPSTPAKTWLDVTNVQPHSTHGVASSPDLDQTSGSDESSISSLSMPGSQGGEAPHPSHLSAGIRREVETTHAKALASVPFLPTTDPQDEPLPTTGIRREAAIPLLSSSVVAHTSQPRIGILPGGATAETQSEPVSHLPTIPILPTTDPQDDSLLTTGIRRNAVVPLQGSSVVALTSQPRVGILPGGAVTGIRCEPGLSSNPHNSAESLTDVTLNRQPPPTSSEVSLPSSSISSEQSSVGIRSGLLSVPPSQPRTLSAAMPNPADAALPSPPLPSSTPLDTARNPAVAHLVV